MGNNSRKNGVTPAFPPLSGYLDNRGYTLIEVSWVLTLMILLISILISIQLAMHTQLRLSESKTHAIQDCQAFFSFVSQEIERARRIYSTNQEELHIQLHSSSYAKYYLNGTNIIRATSSNGTHFSGYTILLQNVDSFTFNVSASERAVDIEVATKNGAIAQAFSSYLTTNLSYNP